MVEYPFVMQSLDGLPRGRVLDVGCTDSANLLTPLLAALGWQVYGLDRRQFGFKHPNFHFICADIRRGPFPDRFFDCVCAISTLEHVGIAGRYGVKVDDPDGDIKAVQEISRLLRPQGLFLMTVPYGQAAVRRPLERVYNRERLQKMLAGWVVQREAYYRLDDGGAWQMVPEKVAGRTSALGGLAIAMLALTPAKRRDRG